MDSQKFCLKWDGFQGNVTSVFDHLRQDSELVDVTLCCEGQRVRAHRMMLSACSPYFRELFKDLSCQQLVIFLKDTSAADLTAIVEFMYKGSVNVAQSQLASFIKTAEMLQVQGLSGGDDKEPPPSPAPPEPSRGGWSQPPGSPAGGLRRPADTAAAASPSEPRHKRRRPEPPPPPPPPPPPAAAAAAAVAERKVSPPPPPTAGAAAVGAPRQEDAPQEQTAVQFENVVKVEKFDVDLTLDDEDAVAGDGGGGGDDLEAALGHVSHYEGYDAGSDQSLSADGQLFRTAAAAVGVGDGALSAAALAAGGPFTPGTSQRAGEDTIQDNWQKQTLHACHVCPARYMNRSSLYAHLKMHTGETTCPLCQLTFSALFPLRRHMRAKHQLKKCEVFAMLAALREGRESNMSATSAACSEPSGPEWSGCE